MHKKQTNLWIEINILKVGNNVACNETENRDEQQYEQVGSDNLDELFVLLLEEFVFGFFLLVEKVWVIKAHCRLGHKQVGATLTF